MESTKSISIRIYLDPLKFAKLLEIMPEYEKGNGENTKPIYWAIDSAIAAKLKESNTTNRNVSNREYLRRP